mmetsp:Transcript_36664/g.105536  ORF Transcript_36664/g.105536 Transcript_36664/m.105536 type:complete len:327 (+) Transcript_36664:1065-2045(+)
MKVAEVDLGERRVVQVRPVDHPNHPIAVRLDARRLRQHIVEICDRLDLRRQLPVDRPGHRLALHCLDHLEGNLDLGLPSRIPRCDRVRRLLAHSGRRAADDACDLVQRQPLRKWRADLELPLQRELQERLELYRLRDGICRARRWVREVRGRGRDNGEGDLRRRGAGRVRGCDPIGPLTRQGLWRAGDAAAVRVQREARGEVRLHGEGRRAAVDSRQVPDPSADLEASLQGRVLQGARRADLDGQTERRGRRPRGVLRHDLEGGLLEDLARHAADLAGPLVEGQARRQSRLENELVHDAIESGSDGDRPEQPQLEQAVSQRQAGWR